MEEREPYLLNKKCRLVLNNGFTLYGIVDNIDQYGVMFRTDQKTAFHSFFNIKELSEVV